MIQTLLGRHDAIISKITYFNFAVLLWLVFNDLYNFGSQMWHNDYSSKLLDTSKRTGYDVCHIKNLTLLYPTII